MVWRPAGRSRIVRVRGSKPSALKMRWVALLSTRMLNWPSALETTPWWPFLTVMLTFARGACVVESRTAPVIVLVCPIPAWDSSPASRKRMI
jgi:hypothetical protein